MRFFRCGLWAPCIFIVVGLGIGLRVDSLGRKSLSREEVLAVALASTPYGAMIERLKDSPLPPLYYSLLHVWVRLAGVGDATVRLPAVLFGLMALPATYLAWRTLVGRRAALWAVALLSLNAFHIWYTNDAKMYSLIWLLATLSSASFLRTALGKPEWSSWHLVYGASCACLPFTSYVGIGPLAVQLAYGVCLVWANPSRRRAVLRCGLIGFAALVPFSLWLAFAVRAAVNRTEIRWIPPAVWKHIPGDLYQLFGTLLIGYQTASEASPSGLWWVALHWSFHLCALVAFFLLAISLFRSRRGPYGRTSFGPGAAAVAGGDGPVAPSRALDAYLVAWFVLPIVETLVFSLSIYSLWGVPRYFAGAAPALLLLLGRALACLRNNTVSATLGLTLLLGNLLAVAFDRTHITRVPMREISRSIQGFAATLQFLEGAQGVRSQSAHVDLPVKLAWAWDKLAIEALLHASDQLTPRVRIVPFNYTSIVRERRPFFLLSRYVTGPGDAVAEGGSAPEAFGGYEAFWVRSDLVYQDRYSTTPSPFNETSVDLFLYYPLRPDPGLALVIPGPPAKTLGAGGTRP